MMFYNSERDIPQRGLQKVFSITSFVYLSLNVHYPMFLQIVKKNIILP